MTEQSKTCGEPCRTIANPKSKIARIPPNAVGESGPDHSMNLEIQNRYSSTEGLARADRLIGGASLQFKARNPGDHG